MKVVEIFGTLGDDREIYTIVIDGKRGVSFCDGEPEDASLSRGFNDVYYITSLMKKAYIAGKSNDGFEIEGVEVNSSREYQQAIDKYVES